MSCSSICLLTIVASAAASTPSLAALDILYPASSYNSRRTQARNAALANAAPSAGIPLAGNDFVFGEFDTQFFTRLLELAEPQAGESFVDIGSGGGRIVMAAALLRPELGSCHGLELLPELHEEAIAARTRFEELESPLCDAAIAPCEYSCLNVFSEEAAAALQAADIIFAYCPTWDSNPLEALASQLKPGARVINVGDSIEGARFEPIGTLVGINADTGPQSTAHVIRIVGEASSPDAPAAANEGGGGLPMLSTGETLSLQTLDDVIGGRVWEAASTLCRWLESEQSALRNTNVLELGSGTGVCGLYAASLGCRSVVLTDGGPPEVLELLEGNIMRNRLRVTKAAGGPVEIRSKELRWGEEVEEEAMKGIRWVIGSDLTYDDDLHEALCTTLHRLLTIAPDARIVLCEEHGAPSASAIDSEGLYADEAFEAFARVATSKGLRASMLPAGAAAWPMRDFERAEPFVFEVSLP